MSVIPRPALGNVTRLGALYNSRNDSFVPISLLNPDAPQSAISTVDAHTIEYLFSDNDSLKEKTQIMGINARLKASFMCGIVDVKGSGGFLNERRDSNQTQQMSMNHKIVTVDETLDFMHKDTLRLHSLQDIDDTMATHMVVGITWGANTIVTTKYNMSESGGKSVAEVKGKLAAKIKQFALDVEGEGAYDSKDNDKDFSSKIEIQVHGDVLPDDGLVPTTLKGAHNFISNVQTYIQKANSGKGKPLSYNLLPLSYLRKLCGMEVRTEAILRELSLEMVEKFTQLFEEYHEAQIMLSDYHNRLKKYRDCVPLLEIQKVENLKKSVIAEEAALKSKYCTALQALRAGEVGVEVMYSLLEEHAIEFIVPNGFNPATEDYTYKMDFYDSVTQKGAKYVGYIRGAEHLEHGRGDVYIFRFNWESQFKSTLFEQNHAMLLTLLLDPEPESKYQIIVKDCDGSNEVVNEPYIVYERNSVVVIKDLVAKRREMASKCIMKYDRRHFKRGSWKDSTSMAKVSLPCPCEECPPVACADWICEKCDGSILYSSDDNYLYCDCGRCRHDHWSFHCSNPIHGAQWSMFSSADELVSFLPACGPIDILAQQAH